MMQANVLLFLANAASNLRSTDRDLEYGYDEDEYGYDGDAEAEVAYYNATDTNTTATNSTMNFDGAKQYVVSQVTSTIASSPSDWSQEMWITFAAFMFVFGTLASCFCLFFVFPCCCPTSMRTAYARMIAPPQDAPKKVRLLHR